MFKKLAILVALLLTPVPSLADSTIGQLPGTPTVTQQALLIIDQAGRTYRTPVSQFQAALQLTPSQMNPSTTQQATFGGSQPYSFTTTLNVPSLNAANGVSSGSSTYGPTSATIAGAITLNNGGAVTAGSSTYGPTSANVNGGLTANGVTSPGGFSATGSSFFQAGSSSYGPTGATINGPINAGSGVASLTGDGGFARNLSGGAVYFGGSSESVSLDYNLTNAHALTLAKNVGASATTNLYLANSGSLYTGPSTYGPTSASVNGILSASSTAVFGSAQGAGTDGLQVKNSDGTFSLAMRDKNAGTAYLELLGTGTYLKAGSSTYGPTSATVGGWASINGALLQGAAGQFAKRVALVAGTYTYTFPSAYNSVPVCVATSEGTTGTLHVTPSTSSCIVTSTSATDTSMVNIIVIGNPN